ncbi:MAG: ABC transporter transmembrane domain-containing protein, partial [Chloroflexota bacterium]
MLTDVWLKREATPLTVYCHDGSYACDNVDVVIEQYSRALADICAFLDIDRAKLPNISLYLCEMLEIDESDIQLPDTTAHLDLETATISAVYTSESPGTDPEIELMPLVLHYVHGPADPAARFWEDGLAGYLAGKAGAAYHAEAPTRVQKLRDEGQLRPLAAVARQYHEHRSPVATTIAVAFATFLIETRGADRFRRLLTAVRTGDTEAVRRLYGRPISGLDQAWTRRMEATAQQGGGKALAAVKGTAAFFRPYVWSLAGILVTILLALSFDLFIPQALRFVIDNVLGRSPVAFTVPGLFTAGQPIPPEDKTFALLGLLGAMIVMFIINALARLRQAAMTANVSQSVVFDLRMRFLEHIQQLPLSFHSRTPANDVVQRFQTDIAYVAAVLSAGVVPMVSNGIAMILFGFTLISLNPLLSIVALAGLPIFAFSYRQGRVTLRTNQRETVRRNQEIQQAVIENMNAQTLLKTWNQRQSVMERFREKLDLNRELNIRNAMIQQAFARASVLITNGVQVAVLVAGGLVVIWSNGQQLSAGGLIAFYVLLLRLYGPAGLFAGAFQTLTLSADGLDRITNVLRRKVEEDQPDAVTLKPLQDALCINGLSYSPTKGKTTLKDVNIEVKAGSKIAVVGPTGAGKATLMQLLPRTLAPTGGTITWDGIDLATTKRESVRHQIIVLPQDT